MAVPLILLHGLGTGPAGWKPQVDALAGERELVVPRLPLSLAEGTQIVTALLDDRPTADVCGLSLGGLVALLATLQRRERVRRLVLAAAFARLPRRLRVLQLALAGAARVVPARVLVRGIATGVPAPYRAEAERELAAVSSRELAGVLAAGARLDVSDRVRALDTPTLVLCGERDRLNLGLSRELAALLPYGELRIVPGAGHVANLDQPEAFTQALREFLD